MLDRFLDFFVSERVVLLWAALAIGVVFTVFTGRFLMQFFALLTFGVCGALLVGLYFTGDPRSVMTWATGILVALGMFALLSIILARHRQR